MPTYAILGATGKTGGALLQLLLQDPNTTHINAYVRSKAKLLQQNPDLEHNERVIIFEGAITDVALVASALTTPTVDAAFCVLGVNENTPGIHIAQDAAHSIVAALRQTCMTTTDAATSTTTTSTPPPPPPPKLIFLSSASLNPHISSKHAVAHAVISRAMSNVYADLALAETHLRAHESWLTTTFVQPGGLVEDTQKGYTLSFDDYSGFVSYLDLAAAMIEIAETRGDYDGKSVSLQATGTDVKFEPNAPPQILRGLVWHFAPALYWTGRYLGLVS